MEQERIGISKGVGARGITVGLMEDFDGVGESGCYGR